MKNPKRKHVLPTISSTRICSSVPRGLKQLKMDEKEPIKQGLPSGKRSRTTINLKFLNQEDQSKALKVVGASSSLHLTSFMVVSTKSTTGIQVVRKQLTASAWPSRCTLSFTRNHLGTCAAMICSQKLQSGKITTTQCPRN
jgi:hypothetical protein